MLMILCKKIETDNVFEDLCKDKELFDFSNIQKIPNIIVTQTT